MNLKDLPAGSNPPEELLAIIEITQGTHAKCEVDEDTGVLMVDRFLYTPFSYPFNYGFVPSTAAKDGDPLDIVVLSMHPIQAGMGIKVKPIGLLESEDEEGIDHKVIAVPVKKVDPVFGTFEEMDDVPENTRDQIKHFYEHYKDLEPGKWVKVLGWKDKAAALKEVESTIKS